MEKDEIQNRIQSLTHNSHCSNCGMINPKVVPYTEDQGTGHTVCCHEAICLGQEDYQFGNDQVRVTACCWAMAELKFQQQGVDVTKQTSMTRFPLNDET